MCHFLHTGVVKRVPGADYSESEDAQPRTKEESMADRIQQAALSGAHQPDRSQSGEELDLAAPKPKLEIPDYENYHNDGLPGPARPKAAACPPQSEQKATKRQASRESQLQLPPNQFPSPEDKNQRGEQRPDAAKKTRPPSPPEELKTKEWLSLPAHVRMRFPKGEDMDVIHYSAPPFKW